jgi:site-specific DNA recombinase
VTAALAAPSPDLIVMDVYARRSFGRDGDTVHEDEQAAECIDKIEETPGWVLGKVFKDPAMSAWNETVLRPDFQDLMARLESGVSGGFLVWDLNRFSRQPEEGERTLKVAKRRRLVVADLAMEYNLASATGKKVFRDKINGGAYESDMISERSTRGKRLKAKRGKTNASHRGFGRPGYLRNPEGWEAGDPRVTVPPAQLDAEVAAIQDAAARILAGDTLFAIARSWNEAGHRTHFGGHWSNDSVRATLRRPSTAGLIEYKGTVVGESGDGALDKDTWERVCAVFVSRRSGRPASKYLLSGLILCGLCGAKMYGRPRYNKGMGSHRQYWCQLRMAEGTKGSGCGRVIIEQQFADDTVQAEVIKILGNPRHADRLAKVAATLAREEAEARAELERLNGQVDAIFDKEGSTPLWTSERVAKAVAKYEEPIGAATKRLEAARESMPQGGSTTGRIDAAAEWEAADLDGRRRLIERAFPKGLVVLKSESRGRAALNKNRIRPVK